jgi:hypothetical protein
MLWMVPIESSGRFELLPSLALSNADARGFMFLPLLNRTIHLGPMSEMRWFDLNWTQDPVPQLEIVPGRVAAPSFCSLGRLQMPHVDCG